MLQVPQPPGFYSTTHLLVPAGQQTRLWDSSGRGRPLRRRTALDSSVGGPLSPAGSD